MKRLFLFAVFLFSLSPASSAGEPAVEVAAIASSVENLVPVGVSERFSSKAGRLYCYSKIRRASGQNIKHIWYLNDRKFNEVTLQMKSNSYRAYSIATIREWMKGKGKVEIITEDGNVLKTVEFSIE